MARAAGFGAAADAPWRRPQGIPFDSRLDLQALVDCGGALHLCDVKLGNISFNFSSATSAENGEDVLYENVSAAIFRFRGYEIIVH